MDESSNLRRWSEDGEKTTISHIPERRSSKVRLKKSSAASLQSTESRRRPPLPSTHETPRLAAATVRPRGKASSPLRRPDSHAGKPSSRTFVPAILPLDLLYAPKLTCPRILLDLRLSSPIFIGGATVEGDLQLVIDGGSHAKRRKHSPAISIVRIYVAVLGIESCRGRQEMFRALMTDLVDLNHPLPADMRPELTSENAWSVAASSSVLTFCSDLPVMMGPPPYESKKTSIRYLVSATVEFFISGKKHFVRQSREVTVLSVHDRKTSWLSNKDIS